MSQENEPNDTPIELNNDDLVMLTAYLSNNLNGTRAWMATHPRASYDSAKTSASEWLTKPNVKAEIKRILTERAMSAEEVVARMAAIAKADLYPFIRIDDDGFVYFNFSDPQAKEYLYLIKEMETKRERRVEGKGDDTEIWEGEWVKVKLHDAYTALRDIAKMHGKLTDRVDITSNGESVVSKLSDEERIKQMKELATAIAEEVKKHDA